MGLYLSRYAPLDPFVSNSAYLSRANEAVRLSDLALTGLIPGEFSDFRRRIPYRHAMSVLTGWREQPVAAFRLYRNVEEQDFSEDEVELMNRLAPHVAKAIHLRESAEEQNPIRDTGLLVFGADQDLIYRNEAAGTMLGDVALESVLPAVQGGSMWLRNTSGLYRAEVVPLTPASLLTPFARWGEEARNARPRDGAKPSNAPGVTVVAIEPFRRRHAIANRLERSGLSRREVEVALGVMRGLSNATIARQLFIDEKTVKDHLQHIYEKTRVHTRTELISKMLGLDAEFAYSRDVVVSGER